MSKRALMCLALVACAEPHVRAMAPTSATSVSPPAAPGEARVVFVRPPSSCDTIDYPSVVDENGHFVGNAGSNTAFEVTVPTGRHAFYAVPQLELRAALRGFPYPMYRPVGGIVVDATAGSVAHVAVVIPKGPSLRCGYQTTPYELLAYDDGDAAREEFESWRRDATLMTPDVDAGTRDLQQIPELVCAYVDMARRRLPDAPPTTCGTAAAVSAK